MAQLEIYKSKFKESNPSLILKNIEAELANYISDLRFDFGDDADLVVMELQAAIRQAAGSALLKSRDSEGHLGKYDRNAYIKAFKKYWN